MSRTPLTRPVGHPLPVHGERAGVRGAGVLVVTVLLAGCMVGPDYTRPAIDAPKAFIYEVKDAADTANTQWWKQFNDPVLDQLIAEALANNLNVKVAVANVEQAAGVLTQTRSSLFPQVATRHFACFRCGVMTVSAGQDDTFVGFESP